MSNIPLKKKGNTKIRKDGIYTIVKYHQTDIVTMGPNMFILDNGGYMTRSTKDRLNQVSAEFDLGFNIYQKDYTWYVEYKGETKEFVRGMILAR